jgi:phage regulator Rha-like protein
MTKQPTDRPQIPERVASAILLVRGQRVILDAELAGLYDVPVKSLIRAVKRNLDRFPADFMFQLGNQEVARLRYQIGTSNGRGGRRYLPYAFTEQGVSMLSSVLRSARAVHVNIEIMRAFVELRAMLVNNEALARKLAELEARYDDQFRAVFDAIRELMTPAPDSDKRPIGFVPSE